MAYEEAFADRIRRELKNQSISWKEIKMFGGLAFMLNEHMAVGIYKGDLMVRCLPESFEQALKSNGVKPLVMNGKQANGFCLVNSESIDMDKDLAVWVQMGIAFSQSAPQKIKSSKRSKKS